MVYIKDGINYDTPVTLHNQFSIQDTDLTTLARYQNTISVKMILSMNSKPFP